MAFLYLASGINIHIPSSELDFSYQALRRMCPSNLGANPSDESVKDSCPFDLWKEEVRSQFRIIRSESYKTEKEIISIRVWEGFPFQIKL
jgi:hypothetical protein